MSGRATGWVGQFGPRPDDIAEDGTTYGQKARGLRMALLAIADAADVNGRHAHPGTEAVANFALYSHGQARRLLDALEAEGWVTVTERGGGRGVATVFDLVTDERNRHLASRASCAPLGGEQREANARTSPHKRAHQTPIRAHPGEPPTVSNGRESNGEQTLSLPLEDPEGSPMLQSPTPAVADATLLVIEFGEFWTLYPRGTGKAPALKAYERARKKATGDEILEGLRRQMPDLGSREPQFVPHAATWLNQERWTDEPPPQRAGARVGGPRPQAPVSYANTEEAGAFEVDAFAHRRAQ